MTTEGRAGVSAALERGRPVNEEPKLLSESPPLVRKFLSRMSQFECSLTDDH